MPRLLRKEQIMLSQYGNTIYGLSTDSKPSGTALNGREFKEMDTSKTYHYDAENEQWIEWSPSSSAESTP